MSDRQRTAELLNQAFAFGETKSAQLSLELTDGESAAICRAAGNLREVERLAQRAIDRIGRMATAIDFAERATRAAAAEEVAVAESSTPRLDEPEESGERKVESGKPAADALGATEPQEAVVPTEPQEAVASKTPSQPPGPAE